MRGERPLPLLIPGLPGCIILPAESNLVTLEGHETVVGDVDAMVVAGEITKHMMASAGVAWHINRLQMLMREMQIDEGVLQFGMSE